MVRFTKLGYAKAPVVKLKAQNITKEKFSKPYRIIFYHMNSLCTKNNYGCKNTNFYLK